MEKVSGVYNIAINNSSWSYTNNLKNDFLILILAEGGTFGINRALMHQKKKIDIRFSKAKTKFAFICKRKRNL